MIQQFHLLWMFQWRLPSISTQDEGLATLRQYQSMHMISFRWCLDQNSQKENNLTTLPLNWAVFPVVIASLSSGVEKDGNLYRNMHKKQNFWISYSDFFTYLPILMDCFNHVHCNNVHPLHCSVLFLIIVSLTNPSGWMWEEMYKGI